MYTPRLDLLAALNSGAPITGDDLHEALKARGHFNCWVRQEPFLPGMTADERAGYNTSTPPGWHPKGERLARVDFLRHGDLPKQPRRKGTVSDGAISAKEAAAVDIFNTARVAA